MATSTDDPSSPGGGPALTAAGDMNIAGDVIGRDKIVQHIQHIYQTALTAAEVAQRANAIETQTLAHGISALAHRLQARAQSEPAIDNPYQGLLPYELGDAERFFGRDLALRELQQHLERSSLTVLHAESGAGKTSLLQAGLAPRLIGQGHLPLHVRPYEADPALKIKRDFIADLSKVPGLAAAPLQEFLRQVVDVLGGQARLVIILDQFEEFFTRADDATRRSFIPALAECLDDHSLGVRWVLALRDEYFGQLASFRPRIQNPFGNDVQLKRFTRAEAHDIAARPLLARGVRFEDGLIDRVLDDLGRQDIAPPQLQLVCEALYEARGSTAVITRQVYDAEGGAAGILGDHLERVLSKDLRPEQRDGARRLLESLITSEQQRVIRSRVELVAELTARGVTPATLDVILTQLIDSRLLIADETDDGLVYELAHDYLTHEIKLDPRVQARKAAQELLEQEVRAQQRYGTLLSAERLKVIDEFHADLLISPAAERLIAASRIAVQRQRQRTWRTRLALGATSGAIGLALIVVLFGAAQRESARIAARDGSVLVRLAGGDLIFGVDLADERERGQGEAVRTQRPIGTFEIEATEVTNRQYLACVTAGACTDNPNRKQLLTEAGRLDLPVGWVDARQAWQYCAWIGRRLPDEYEWERAARGLQGRLWPWGDTDPQPDRVAATFPFAVLTGPVPVTQVDQDTTADVPPIVNLAGNVREWTSTAVRPAANGQLERYVWDGQDMQATLSVRGGAFDTILTRITYPLLQPPEAAGAMLGVRCAQDVP